MKLHTSSRGSRRHRANVLLAVLGASLIVSLIGLSAMTAIRVQRKQIQAQRDAAQASHYARSAVDLGLFKIDADPAWRNNYSAWTKSFTIGNDTMEYILTDEEDGSVSDNPYDRVLLTGKGVVGQATRLYSLYLDPIDDGGPDNLLDNGNMESGTLNWSGMGYATIASETGFAHGDDRCVLVTNRADESAALNQTITLKVANGKTYYTEFWIKLANNSENVKLTIVVYNGLQFFNHSETFPAVETGWTKLSTVKTLSYSLTPVYILWYVHPSVTNQDFYVDDAILVEGTSYTTDPTEVAIVPGSWKRDVLP